MTGREERYQQAINKGHSAAWDQAWDQAASFYRQAIEESPENALAWSSLGLALYEQQDYEEALRAYQNAARFSIGDPVPLEKVAQILERLDKLDQAAQTALKAAEQYMKNRDVTKAIEHWAWVTRLSPENMQAHARLALVYERMGNKQRAVPEYLAVASLFQSAGDIEKAVRSVNQALQIAPNHEGALKALTLLRDFKPLPKPSRPRIASVPLHPAGKDQLPAPRLTDTREMNADPIAEARQLAITALAELIFEESEDHPDEQIGRRNFQSIAHGIGGVQRQMDRSLILLHLSLVIDSQSRGENSRAAAELEHAISAGLNHPAASFDLGYLYAQSGQYDRALRELKLAIRDVEFALGAHLLMGEVLRKMGRIKDASIQYLEALRQADALAVPPEHADDLRQLYEPLIESHARVSDPEAEQRLCENISELLMKPDWRKQLARAREQLPDRKQGGPPVPVAEILTEAQSGQIVQAISAIHDLAQKGHLHSAMEECFYALQEAPTYLPLHSYMGELLLKQDQLQDAIAKFMVVARAYSIRGETGRAVDLYRRIIELAPMDLSARQSLIEHLVSCNLVEDALNEYLGLAEVYYSLADLEKARETYAEAQKFAYQVKLDVSHQVRILHQIADIDLQSLDWRQALRIYEQIRKLQPDDEQARLSLIELNFRLGRDNQAIAELDNYLGFLLTKGLTDKAATFVESILAENPDKISVRRRLAEIYRQSGKIETAIEQLDAIGDALLEADDRAGAAEAIEAILAMNPPNKADYLRLLAQIRGR